MFGDLFSFSVSLATVKPYAALVLVLFCLIMDGSFKELLKDHYPSNVHSFGVEHKPVIISLLVGGWS